MTPEITLKMQEWRAKALEGTLTLEETKEAIIFLRESRRSAVASKAGGKKSPILNADDLLDELGGL